MMGLSFHRTALTLWPLSPSHMLAQFLAALPITAFLLGLISSLYPVRVVRGVG